MTDNPHREAVWAVVPASGSGSRFSKQQDKLLANLDGTPVLVRTLQALRQVKAIQGIVLVSSQQNQSIYQALVSQHIPELPIRYAIGGSTRRESVYQGLLAVSRSAQIVTIHDAARPLINPEAIAQTIEKVQQGAAGAVVAIPIHDTVKQVAPDNLQIQATLDRSLLWRVQTPQTFRRSLLLHAHEQLPQSIPVTDDAQLMELAELGSVVIVPGDESNLKITVSQDILMAEAFLKVPSARLL